MIFCASIFLVLNSSTCSLTLFLSTSYFPNTNFFNFLSSSLNRSWCSQILIAVSFNSLYIFSFVSSTCSFNSSISTFFSKSLASKSSVRWSISWSNLSFRFFILSPTLIKSSSITLKVLPIHVKSGTSLTSLTHLGKTGISDLTLSIASHIASISVS